MAGGLAAILALAAVASPAGGADADRARILDLAPDMRWETFTTADGLPSNRAFAVRIDGDSVWAGTTQGLALYRDGRWTSYGTDDGLPHSVILALDVCSRTGDLWIGTMGGLARFSGGRFDTYTQLNSGLSNDFVHGVRCDPDEDAVWAATAMGASRLDLRTGNWSVFTQENTPMHEPWTYSITIGGGRVFVGAWGAGILELNKQTGSWREYRDPDKEFEIDLFPDDGPVSDITSGIDMADGILWQGSYFGAARYDGRDWRNFFIADSGLASDFVNFVRAQGPFGWFATDQGLSVTDGEGWVRYRRLENGTGETTLFSGSRQIGRHVERTALPHNYVLGVDASGDDVWVATEKGIGHGVRTGTPVPHRAVPAETDEEEPETISPGPRFHYSQAPDPLLPFATSTPYYQLFTQKSMFRGVGRDEPEPKPDSVRVGFIGPLTRADVPSLPLAAAGVTVDPWKAETGRRMLHAVQLAIDQANAAGGYRGIPFELVPRTDLVLWGQSSNELVGFSLKDKVWGIVTGVDSNHNHVMSRATLKIELPIVAAGSSDPTLVEHAIPWLVRCINDDRQNGFLLLDEIVNIRHLTRPALLRVNDRDGRTGVDEFVQGARRLGHPVLIELRFNNGDTDFGAQLAKIVDARADALVLWGNPVETGLIVRQARKMGIDLPIFGFDRMTQEEFLKQAGEAAEGVVVSASMNPDSRDPSWVRFRDSYRKRWGEEPGSFAAHAYDGMNLLISAIREAGLNRARIRDAMYRLDRYHGVTGEIIFDTNMTDIGPPWLATVRGGRFVYEPAPAWPSPEGTPPPSGVARAGAREKEGHLP